MKKLVFTTLALLLPLFGAVAQNSHWTLDPKHGPDETVLYCTLVQENPTPAFNQSQFEVAAFIDEEVRAIGEYKRDNYGVYFIVRVKGDLTTDNGKTITFKAYDTQTQIEYDLTLKESPLPVTFDGETKDPGIPSNMRKLYITEITAISLPQVITIAKGETVDLLQYITVTPSGASLPSNLTWDFANSSSYISVANNQLTGLAATDGAHLGLSAGTLSARTTVVVTNPATAITIKNEYKEITVNKDDTQTLTNALQNAYTLTPADASDNVVWSIADPTIVQDLAPTAYGWKPIKAGTTTMTAQIMNGNGAVRLSATLTVHVVVPVESISLNFPTTIGFNCNVGDDLTNYLNSIVVISPDDATDKSVTWSVLRGSDIVSVDGNGKITALKAGSALLQVASNNNPNATATISVDVHNPATDVQFAQQTVYVDGLTAGQSLDIGQLLTNNITFLPAGFEEFGNDDLRFDSDNGEVVVVKGNGEGGNRWVLTGYATDFGEANITVSFSYTNWLGTYANPNGNNTVTVSKSFKVVVNEDKSVQSFAISADVVFGQTGTITVTPTPADAVYEATDVRLEFTSSTNGLPTNWAQVNVSNPTKGTDGKTTFEVEVKAPGKTTVKVYVGNDLKGEQEIDVPAPFDLVDGWQWKSLYYGDVPAGEMEKAFGGDNLVEVRSQTQLLYNDPTYGYFGEIAQNGILQNVCYKVKMAGTFDPYLLYGGTLRLDPTAVSLNTGWTWIANPYLYRRTLSRIQTSGLSEGDRIVSKNNGFAEFDGTQWTGSLTMLEPGQGYLFYTESGSQFYYDSEFNLEPANDGGANPAPMQGTSPWQYDASQYRDNMSIVAVAENVGDLVGNYSVGAFVGEECRGEGVMVGGRLFITVHGQAGEQVSFRIQSGGEQFTVGETLPFSSAAGSLKAPVKLTKKGEVTGISTLNSTDETAENCIFNANGVQQQQLRRGVNIVRQQDGTVRKVIVK